MNQVAYHGWAYERGVQIGVLKGFDIFSMQFFLRDKKPRGETKDRIVT